MKVLLFVAISCLVFTSCQKEDSNSNPEPQADYTIMMYGCGGGNLDSCMIYNIAQVAGYGYSPNVQFAAKLKYSKPFQQEDPQQYGGTRLYTLTEQGMTNERVGSQGFRLDDPQNLANFIVETKKRLPAKKYVLILWNHGSTFDRSDQLVAGSYPEHVVESRSLVFDDNNGENISIFELENALQLAGTKFDLLYWDVCLMNMIENLYQIKDHTDYVLGAAHLTPGIGGNYANLMHALENNNSILAAMQEYVPATVKHWGNMQETNLGVDLTLSDMRYIDEVGQNVKKYIDALISYRDGLKTGSDAAVLYSQLNGTPQMRARGEGKGKFYHYYSPKGVLYYFDSDFYSVDLYSAFTRIGSSLLDGNLSAYATRLKFSIDKMIPVSACLGTPDYLDKVSIGINWMDKAAFEEVDEAYPITTLESLYDKLTFNKVTGWSRFLKTNIMYTND